MQVAAPHVDRLTESRRQAERTYDRLSRWYDILADASEKRARNLGLDMLVVESGEDALEIGVGTGHAAVALAQSAGPDAMVVGMDAAWRMLQRARARVSKSALSGRVSLIRAEAARLPFRDGRFDVVFMSFVLEIFDTAGISVVLSECHRVLRPGGRICIVSLSVTPSPGPVERAYAWAHRRLPAWIDCRPIRVQESLDRAGFVTLDAVRVSTWGLPIAVVVARKP